MPVQTKQSTPKADTFSEELADDLRQQLELASEWAKDQFAEGYRVHGWTPATAWATTFLKTYFLKGGLLRGTGGFVASSRAAMHASNRAAMLYCMAIEED